LRDDVIKASPPDRKESIEDTATRLLGARDDLIKVLGTAFALEEIEPDDSKGIKEANQVKTCLTAFGIQAADVFQLISKFLNENEKSRFKQIGQWFADSESNWTLIDKHGVDILKFGNIEDMKNAVKI
jgi:hypothetical protein